MFSRMPITLATKAAKVPVIIIGAGPAGLACGISARQCTRDREVLILEKLPRVGGCCITSTIGNFKFEVGCNQPPLGFERILKNLGINQQFLPKANECVFEDATVLTNPANFRTITKFLSQPISSARFFWRASRYQDSKMLSSITHGLEPKFANQMQSTFAYPALMPDITLELLRKFIISGRDSAQIPVGGMASVTDKMLAQFIDLGGKVIFNRECKRVAKLPNGKKLIITADGSLYEAGLVISSDAWKHYPTESKPGLAMTTLLFAVKNDLKYPKGIHTIAFLPNNFMKWMGKLDQFADFPDEFGFHCFINSLPEQSGCYTITVYILTSRGISELTEEQTAKIKQYVKSKIGCRIPNFSKSIVEEYVLSPVDYKRKFSLANNIPLLIPPPGFVPPGHNMENDTHFIGSSVSIPSVLAAVESGAKKACDLLLSNSSEQLRP